MKASKSTISDTCLFAVCHGARRNSNSKDESSSEVAILFRVTVRYNLGRFVIILSSYYNLATSSSAKNLFVVFLRPNLHCCWATMKNRKTADVRHFSMVYYWGRVELKYGALESFQYIKQAIIRTNDPEDKKPRHSFS